MSPLNQFFLLSLVIAVPLAIHIFGINVHRKVYLGNISPLLGADFEASGVNKLRKRLLLAARLLFILLLALAFVYPNFGINKKSLGVKIEPSKSMIDNSSSVCAARDGQDVSEIQSLILKTNKNSLYSDKNQSADFFNSCLDYPVRLSDYSREIKAASNNYLFSDFQRSFIDLDKLPYQSATLNLIKVGYMNDEANISIDSIWLDENFIKKNTASIVYVQLRNNGKEENKKVLVELKVGGKSIASNLEQIAPLSTKKVQFPILLRKEEDKFCEVRIDDASWTFDNQFYFVLNPIEKLPVVLVTDQKYSDPIKLAFGQETIFDCSSILKLGNENELVQKASMIVLSQAENPNNADLESIITFAKNGGTSVIIPSDKWKKKEIDIINTVIGNVVTENITSEDIELEVPDIKHPFFQNIFEKVPYSTNMPYVHLIWHIKDADETILKTKKGEAALASFKIGKGKLYLFSFDIDKEETFSRSAIFLPVFYRMAELSAKNRVKPFFRITDDVIEFTSKENYQGEDNIYTLVNGGLKIIPEQRLEGDKIKLFLPKEGMSLGIWHVMDKAGTDVVQFGLNSDKEESVVDFYSIEELKDKFKDEPRVKVLTLDEFKKEVKELTRNEDHWPMWRYAILICFLFLLAEMAIARYYKIAFYRSSKLSK